MKIGLLLLALLTTIVFFLKAHMSWSQFSSEIDYLSYRHSADSSASICATFSYSIEEEIATEPCFVLASIFDPVLIFIDMFRTNVETLNEDKSLSK